MRAGLAQLMVVAGAVLTPVTTMSAAESPSTARGVYTSEQAGQGEQLYAASCALCHGKDLLGTYEIPPLKGRFLGNWAHAPLGRLFDYVSRAMPLMAPGSLSSEQSAAIVAYLLQQNGMSAGTRPMADDAKVLDSITIELPKSSPR